MAFVSGLRKIVNAFTFVASGIVAITVGFFMLRGNMNLWQRKDSKNNDADDDS